MNRSSQSANQQIDKSANQRIPPSGGRRLAGLAGADLIPGVPIGGELAGIRAARIGQIEGLAADRLPRDHERLREIELLARHQRHAGEEVAVTLADLAAVVEVEVPGP